jgi:imidazolonepropionase-like amidohydrolase
MAGRLGEISPGAYADLLVVDGDQLADVALLARPDRCLKTVVKAGQAVS